MKQRPTTSFLLILTLIACRSALAVDGISVSPGREGIGLDADITLVRLALQWQWQRQWFASGDWYLSGHWEPSIAYWDSDSTQPASRSKAASKNLSVVAIAPVFRLQKRTPWFLGITPYGELGVGLSLFSKLDIETNEQRLRRFGIHFQFEDRVGLGIRFGDDQRFELGYRYFHFSNAGISQMNNGIELQTIVFGYWF